MTEVAAQEPHQLTGNLQPGRVRVQQQPIDTFDLERRMTLEHIVDVRHARHLRSMTPPGPALPDRRRHTTGGRPGGGSPPTNRPVVDLGDAADGPGRVPRPLALATRKRKTAESASGGCDGPFGSSPPIPSAGSNPTSCARCSPSRPGHWMVGAERLEPPVDIGRNHDPASLE